MVACVPGGPAGTRASRVVRDVGPTDISREDAAEADDGGVSEADAGSVDLGLVDAGRVDAGRVDAGTLPPTGQRSETPDRLRHIYSQLQAWSTDGLYFLGVDIDSAEGVVLHAGTREEVARMGRIGHRWVTGTHAVLMFDDPASTGAALFAYDIDTRMETEVMRLGHPGLRAGRSQEEMDREGRWVAVYIDQAQSGGPRIVTADIIERQKGADIAISALGCQFEPDWVGVDPTGTYLLVQSVQDGRGQCMGLWAHDIRSGAPIRQLTDHHNHGTTGLSGDGRPYFLSTELTHPNDNGSPGIYRYWLDDARREVVGPPLPWGALAHVSCLGDPGEACVVSGSDEFPGQFSGQIWRLDYDGTRTVLEPHNANGCDYWGQPQATVGPGGRYAFATHGGNCARIRSVLVQ